MVGPWQQMKSMLERNRVIPSSIFIVSSVFTLVAALQMQNIMIVMFLICIQICSAAWYLLTYIPMGERMIGWVWTAFRSMF